MDAYCKEMRTLEGKFYSIEYSHVVRDKNQAANALSKLGSSRVQVPHGVFVQDLLKPSIKQEASGSFGFITDHYGTIPRIRRTISDLD
jgi:hypothetical protein